MAAFRRSTSTHANVLPARRALAAPEHRVKGEDEGLPDQREDGFGRQFEVGIRGIGQDGVR